MEGLVGLVLTIFFIVRAINKAKEGKEKPQTPVERPPKEMFFGDLVDFDKQAEAQPKQAEAPRTTKERLQKNELHFEGSSSHEGLKSTEGECIEENPNHCAVVHSEDSVYATEITDAQQPAFDRQELVKGIVMAEILSKPKCFE